MNTKIWRGAAAVLVACLNVFSAPAEASTVRYTPIDVSDRGAVLGRVFPGEGVRITGSGDVADEPGNTFSRFFTQGLGGPDVVNLTFGLDFSQSNATAAQILLFGSPTAPDEFLYQSSPLLSESFWPVTIPLNFADAGTISFELVVNPFTADGGPDTLTGDLFWSLSGSYEKPFVPPPDPGGGGTMAPTIPLPAAVWMLMAGLGGLGVLRLRKQRQCAA